MDADTSAFYFVAADGHQRPPSAPVSESFDDIVLRNLSTTDEAVRNCTNSTDGLTPTSMQACSDASSCSVSTVPLSRSLSHIELDGNQIARLFDM